MENKIKRPTDPYDPAWDLFAAQNPGLRRSLSAADPDDNGGAGGSGDGNPDFGTIIPESFKNDDGWDVDGFKEHVDGLTAFKARMDERQASIPEDPSEYAFAPSDDHEFPEGFDPDILNTTDDEGNEVKFDPKSFFDADDPDLKSVQSLMHSLDKGEMTGAEAAQKLAGVMLNRELSGLMKSVKDQKEQIALLGETGKARINTVAKAVEKRVPEAQAKAILDGITSADALKGMEALLSKELSTSTPPAGGKKHSDMTPQERIMSGIEERGSRRS